MSTQTASTLEVAHSYMVSPKILALQIQSGEVVKGTQQPYVAAAGDQVNDKNWVSRNGQIIGQLVGEDAKLIRTLDQVVGPRLDTDWAENLRNYKISSAGDNNYAGGVSPVEVFRKSKPIEQAQIASWDFDFALNHTLYLELPQPLQEGETYQISFGGDAVSPVSFAYDPEAVRSEAVHVSHLGFDPDDPAKVAFLSQWMGDGGPLSYREGMAFQLVDEATGAVVYEGQTELSKSKDSPEDRRGRNYTGTDVFEMDFSNFQKPGQYRVVVEGVGASFPFEIGEKTWESAFKVSARGLYHQRSGIALEQPYTDYERPRPFHPEDGVKVYQSTATLMDTSMGLNLKKLDSFKALQDTRTQTLVPDAWGGWFDAGDWDRRIQHLSVSRLYLELAELNPGYFEQLDYNIPESGNALPDVVDEALWGLDLFRRLQTADGGIPGGVESAGHPKGFEGSWQESQTVMVYGPDVWSSYIYAGVAARAAHLLKEYDAALASTYEDSAIRAMDWAEQAYPQHQGEHWRIESERNLAAAELYRLTGGQSWHDLFLETTVFEDQQASTFVHGDHDQRDAAFVYARLNLPSVDQSIQKNARNALIQDAEGQMEAQAETAFKWNKNPWAPLGWGTGPTAPDAAGFLRAHYLTNNPTYLEAGVLATQFAAGANPDNMVYTTGLGYRSPQDPMIADVRAVGAEPPPGITVYGPLDLQWQSFWATKQFEDLTGPAPKDWPTLESYFDVYYYIPATEFTIQQSMAPTAYTWGYLAASDEWGNTPASDTPLPGSGADPVSTPTPPAIQFDSFAGASDLIFNGSAAQADNLLRLTSAVRNQAGSAFYKDAFAIDSDTSFATQFQFRLGQEAPKRGADGFTFTLLSDAVTLKALGESGGQLGYGNPDAKTAPAMSQSLAIEFDTYSNSWDRGNSNHVAILQNGDVAAPLATASPSFDLNSNQVINAWVDYDGTRDQLDIFLSETATKPDTALLSTRLELDDIIGTGAHVGFTAGTGGLTDNHDILSWTFNPSGVAAVTAMNPMPL